MSSNVPASARFRKPFAKKNNETFTVVVDSIDESPLNGQQKDTCRKLKRLIRMCGGQCDWPVRRIAAYCKLALGTYKDHYRAIKAAGWLEVEERRRFGCRQNYTNILRFRDGGLTIQRQVHTEKYLKTKAPTRENPRVEITPAKREPKDSPAPQQAPVRPIQASEFRLTWEANRGLNVEAHRRMLASYEAVGRGILAEQAERQTCRERNQRDWREGRRDRWDGGREYRRDQARQRCSQAQAEASALSYWDRPEVKERCDREAEEVMQKYGAQYGYACVDGKWIQSGQTLNT